MSVINKGTNFNDWWSWSWGTG